MGEKKISFFIIDIILLVVLLGLITTIFRLSGLKFLLELLFTIIIILLSFIALIPAYKDSRLAWITLSVIFLAIILDLFVVSSRIGTGKIFFLTLLFSSFGFLVSVINIKEKEIKGIEETEEIEDIEAPEEKTTKKIIPEKYVASKTGTTYHIPNCEWAEKIKEKNKVWFDNEKEAKKKYKPHSCVRKK